jgi:hypothetical protein
MLAVQHCRTAFAEMRAGAADKLQYLLLCLLLVARYMLPWHFWYKELTGLMLAWCEWQGLEHDSTPARRPRRISCSS